MRELAAVPDAHAPPHDESSELIVLGGMLADPALAAELLELAPAKAFYRQAHRIIASTIAAMVREGKPTDPVAVARELDAQSLAALDGGPVYLHAAAGEFTTPTGARHHAGIVAELARKRAALAALIQARAQLEDGSAEEAVARARAALDALALDGAGGHRLEPLDWARLQAEGLPRIEYVREPYIPKGARVWAAGPAESGKSLWALWQAAELTREGRDVVYVSQENPLAEDVRRLDRLRPDWAHLRFFHGQELDVALAEDVARLIRASQGAALIVLDTATACWSGDENDNAALVAFDRDVLQRVVRETGASVLVLDHTGHPQAFVRRRGVSAPRGASSKGQKADVVLEFRAEGPSAFLIEHGKNRLGGRRAPPRRVKVIDAEDGTLAFEEIEDVTDAAVKACAEAMVEAIRTAGSLTTRALREAVKGAGGRDAQAAAMRLLEAEDPPRVRASEETTTTESGRQRAKVWRPASGDFFS